MLARGGLSVPGAVGVNAEWVTAVLDRHRIPDGFPFVIDDDGTTSGCDRLNRYLLDAWGQNASSTPVLRSQAREDSRGFVTNAGVFIRR